MVALANQYKTFLFTFFHFKRLNDYRKQHLVSNAEITKMSNICPQGAYRLMVYYLRRHECSLFINSEYSLRFQQCFQSLLMLDSMRHQQKETPALNTTLFLLSATELCQLSNWSLQPSVDISASALPASILHAISLIKTFQ